MSTTRKIGVAAIITLAGGFTIYQIQKGPDTALDKNANSAVSSAGTPSGTPARPNHAQAGKLKGGPRALLRSRLDEAGKRKLQQDPGTVLSEHDKEGWGRADDDLLAAWAAKDPVEAMKWVNGGGHAVVRSQLLGAVASGILLRDGKDAMRRFLNEHQQDPALRPKDQGELEKYLFLHLGREDTFDAAMEILRESKDGALAGMMITGIEGAQYQTSAIDYMEAQGIPVDFDYRAMQEDIGKDPRFWADWARQRDSDLLTGIVDGWARDKPDEAKAWVGEHVPEDDRHRISIESRLKVRADGQKTHDPTMNDGADTNKPDTDDVEPDTEDEQK